MTALEDVREIREASTTSLVGVILIMIASAVGFTLLTAQFDKLLGTGGGALPAAIHGLVAFLYLFVGTIGLYLGWRLLTGHIRAFADLQLLAVVAATFSFLAICFGTGYTSTTPLR